MDDENLYSEKMSILSSMAQYSALADAWTQRKDQESFGDVQPLFAWHAQVAGGFRGEKYAELSTEQQQSLLVWQQGPSFATLLVECGRVVEWAKATIKEKVLTGLARAVGQMADLMSNPWRPAGVEAEGKSITELQKLAEPLLRGSTAKDFTACFKALTKELWAGVTLSSLARKGM